MGATTDKLINQSFPISRLTSYGVKLLINSSLEVWESAFFNPPT